MAIMFAFIIGFVTGVLASFFFAAQIGNAIVKASKRLAIAERDNDPADYWKHGTPEDE